MARTRLRVRDLSRPTPGFFLAAGAVVFALGLLGGFFLSDRLGHLIDPASVQFTSLRPVSLLLFWNLFWSYFRWLLFGALLAMSALGLFLLFPLIFLRGLLMGFSFASLFSQGSRLSIFLHFFLTALLTCGPLLLEAAAGMLRGSCELHRRPPEEAGLFAHPAFPLFVLLAGAGLIVLCCFAGLWLVPGFAAYIQSFTQ